MSSFSGISPSSIASYSGLKILVFGDYGAANLRATTSTRGRAQLLAGRSVLLRPVCALAVNDFRRQHKGRGAQTFSSIRLRGLARAA